MKKLLTTLQVRKIMRKHGGEPVYTNKTTGDTSNNRRVKAYYFDNKAMVKALQKKCGKKNVKVTEGTEYPYSYDCYGLRSVIVRCVLA